MNLKYSALTAFASLATLTALGACARAPETSKTDAPAARAAVAAGPVAAEATPASVRTQSAARATPAALPSAHVFKSATCGCCTLWVDHLRENGFTVEVTDVEDLESVKTRLGVPFGKGSCHTAEIDGLFVEGHVPAGDIKRLLADRGSTKGLVLPGMPAGSPGMEMPDGRVARYTVESVNADGTTSPFATHGE